MVAGRVHVRHDGWIATFADLAALLLSFFVLTFSMAVVEPARLTGGGTRENVRADIEPDFATNLVELSANSDNEPAVSENYLLALLRADLQVISQSLPFARAARDEAVELTFDEPLESLAELVDRLDRLMPELRRLQRRIPFTVSVAVDAVTAADAVDWSVALFDHGGMADPIDRVDVHLAIGEARPRLRIRLTP